MELTKITKQMKEQTLTALINYLIQQPYKDVAGLLQMIQEDLNSKEDKEVTNLPSE